MAPAMARADVVLPAPYVAPTASTIRHWRYSTHMETACSSRGKIEVLTQSALMRCASEISGDATRPCGEHG